MLLTGAIRFGRMVSSIVTLRRWLAWFELFAGYGCGIERCSSNAVEVR